MKKYMMALVLGVFTTGMAYAANNQGQNPMTTQQPSGHRDSSMMDANTEMSAKSDPMNNDASNNQNTTQGGASAEGDSVNNAAEYD